MQLLRIPDDSGLDALDRPAQSVLRAALIAHLRGQLFLAGQPAHLARFPDRLRERLLAVNMFAQAHGGDGSRAMHVIRRRDGNGVDRFAHLIEHFAPVAIKLGVVGPTLLRGAVQQRLVFPIQRIGIDVAECDDVAAKSESAVGIAVTLSSHADAGDVDALVRALPTQEVRRADGCCAGEERG